MQNATAIVFIVIFALEAVVIIIGNTFTILVFWSQRFHLKRTCFLLINLAVADLFVGIAEVVLLATEKIPNRVKVEDPWTLPPWATLNVLASATSVFCLALISLERVFAVLWPLRHHVTSTRAYIYTIVIVWAVGLSMGGLWLLTIYHKEVDTIDFTVTSQSFLLISLLVICASYLAIRSRLHRTTPELEAHNHTSTERNLRFSKTFFIVVALSLFLWFPSFVVNTIKVFCFQCFSTTVLTSVNVLHFANSMVNPFVYSFRMPIFKDALKKFRRNRRQNIQLRAAFSNNQNKVEII